MPTDPEPIYINRPDPQAIRKALRFGGCLGLLILFAAIAMATLVPYTEYLWYSHDARHPEVFDIAYKTRGTLFLGAFLVSWTVLYFSMRRALSLSLIYLRAPESLGQRLISNAMSWVQVRGSDVVRIAAPIIAFLNALGFSTEWNTYLLFTHRQAFGVKDPTYGLDLSFFVFTLPWMRAITSYALALCVLTTLLTIGIYVGLQALAMLAKIELSRPHIRFHVSLLIGIGLIAYGVQFYLKTYEVGLVPNSQFTGGGYAAMQQVATERILAFLLVITALVTLFGQRFGKPYEVPMKAGIGLVVYYAIAVVGWPTIAQKFIVDPNRLAKEAPYAEHAISMTRFGYDLNRVEVRDVDVRPQPTKEEVSLASPTLDNMRLWDPAVLRSSLENLQGIRPYYKFTDVDIDRYQIGGKQTMVMLAPRDLDLNGLDSGARNWTNERLRYTHGYGLTLSLVNTSTPDGQPDFLARDIPQTAPPDIKIDQPRIYFSDARDQMGDASDEYALVDTDVAEFDYPTTTGSENHRWKGDRGIPLGFLAKLAFSAVLADGNLLVSGNVTSQTRLLMHRNIHERAKRIYPFLEFDRDPYLVVLGGKLLWLMDGYTSTGQVPYSNQIGYTNGAINYIRNSVKVVVDAYTGETHAYAVLPDDPLLKAYRAIYPTLVEDAAAIPKGLVEHFRYPEDLFQVQCLQWASFHVTDPTMFLSNGDAWEIAKERGLTGATEMIRPYYVEMQLPDEPKAGFLQILPFTPLRKVNMSGWLAAHCDPGDYGRLTLYRFTKGSPVGGPELLEGNFSSTPDISNINRQFNNDQSSITVGNLLVIPIGRSVMYAEPLFLKSNTSGIQAVPRLFRVILALNDKIVVAPTYKEALTQLFGDQTAPAPTTPTIPGTTPQVVSKAPPIEQAKAALKLLDDAELALKNGDFAKYGELQKAAKKRLQQLVGAK